MEALYKFLKSIKLAIVLILVITGLSLLSTLVPQGKELAYYYNSYSPFMGWLIVSTRFYDFFTSLLFIAPSALFFANLLTCTIDRLSREFRKKGKRRHGPDLLHIGLLVLLVGGVVTFTGRKEGFMNLGTGDKIKLPGGYVLTLESFEFLTYENGTPKDWISTVDVERAGKLIVDSYPIEVNKPLKVGNIDIYQNSYSMEQSAALISPEGEEAVLVPGHTIEDNGALLLYVGNQQTGERNTAVFEVWEGQDFVEALFLQPGDQVGRYRIGELGSRSLTGLQAVVDPGFVPVLIGLILLGVGLFLTYYQKLGEKQS